MSDGSGGPRSGFDRLEPLCYTRAIRHCSQKCQEKATRDVYSSVRSLHNPIGFNPTILVQSCQDTLIPGRRPVQQSLAGHARMVIAPQDAFAT